MTNHAKKTVEDMNKEDEEDKKANEESSKPDKSEDE